ncbi:MAG: HTTM domain-containing protein [Myxococcota bacterium]
MRFRAWARNAGGRATAFARWFAPRYLDADLRTLGLWRIVIGLFLIVDTLRHAAEIRFFYSNEGLFQNHWHLFSPTAEFNWSLLTAFSTPTGVTIAFAAALVCFACFTVGFKTRAFNALSLVWVVSIDQRLLLRENGGYIVVVLLAFWSLFLPMGARFSVDRWRRRGRARRGMSPHAIATDPRAERPAGAGRGYRSLAVALVLFNFASIYIFNVVNKFGTTWRSGQTVHYVLHLDRMVTPLAVWARELLPYPVTVVITWSVLVVEALIAMCILWPSQRRFLRPIALLLLVPLHTSFGVMMRLGPFSWAMIAFSVFLVAPVHWEMLGRWFRRRTPVVRLGYHGPTGTRAARILALLDRGRRLTIVAPDGSSRSDGSGLWLVDGARRYEGRAAWWRALSATPSGFVLAPMVRIMTLGLADLLVAVVAARPDAWAHFFGWRGQADDDAPARFSTRPTAAAPPTGLFRRSATFAREGLLVVLLLFETSQLINENKAFPKPMKHTQPKAIRAVIGYPRLFQGWGMFAPNPIRKDGRVGIDAITVDGRHIDPLRVIGGLSPAPDLDLSDDRGSGYNQIHQDYQNRIQRDQNRSHRTALQRLLTSWHERTGRPQDEIVHFDVYWLRDDNPAPGALAPKNPQRRCLASWRKPGVHRAGDRPLPPRCKVTAEPKKDPNRSSSDPAGDLPPFVARLVRWWRGD